MYQALYRKYRPSTFDDVVGQKVIIKTLSNSIINNKINHAYIFAGPRGTGKTSIAKIMAKLVNCENLDGVVPCNKCVNCTQTSNNQNTDIIEIDAASNNGVDEIRELRDKVNLVPSFGKYKVYIIDEVHMLTTAAFNALLKTLEEPPKHIIFILATTEPYKIPITILSRCQKFDFKKISIVDIENRLRNICKTEKILIEDTALNLIAKLSDGGMRDALSLLDQLTVYSSKKITVNDVHDVCGTITYEEIYNLFKLIFDKKIKEVFDLIECYDNDGKNLIKIMEGMIEFLKDTLINCNCSSYFDENIQLIHSDISTKISESKIYDIIDVLLEYIKNCKLSNNVVLLFELSIIKIIELNNKLVEQQQSENESIFELKPKIKFESKVEPKKISQELNNKIEELKKKRINNTLSKFNKKELTLFKKEDDTLKELLLDPDFSSITSLILDGEVKAKGDKNLIYVYKLSNLADYFNASLLEVEKVLKKAYNIELKPIAVYTDDWEIIKLEFNKKIKNNKNDYIYEDEEDIKKIFKDSTLSEKNSIESEFEDIIVYD